ncbi:MAG: MarC family protein [Myxococcota bacterium]
MDVFRELAQTAVAIFAVFGALPIVPTYLGLTGDLDAAQKARARNGSFATVLVVGALFTLIGGDVLRALGLRVADLRIAGGLTLLVFAIHDLLFSRAERKQAGMDADERFGEELGLEAPDVAIVPLGIPLLLGPATMTALAVFAQTNGRLLTLGAFLANLALNYLILWNADAVARRLGPTVVRAAGKVMGIFLAAIAVAMLRAGIHELITDGLGA